MVLPEVTTLAEAQDAIRELAEENEKLSNELAWFRRQLFGSKTEHYIPRDDTPSLFPEEMSPESPKEVPTATVAEHERKVRQAERICRFSSAGGADRNRKRSGRAGASSFRNFQCFSVPESPNSRSAPPKLSSRFGADSGIARQRTSVRRISSKSTRPTAKGPNPTLGYRRSESGGMENTYR